MTKKRRNLFCARILCASILFSLAAPVSAEETASAVSVEAPEYVLMEPETGTVILEKDKDVPRSPASVTKVMTLLLIFEEIESKNQEEKQMNQKFVEIIKMCLIRDEKKRPTAKDIVRLL